MPSSNWPFISAIHRSIRTMDTKFDIGYLVCRAKARQLLSFHIASDVVKCRLDRYLMSCCELPRFSIRSCNIVDNATRIFAVLWGVAIMLTFILFAVYCFPAAAENRGRKVIHLGFDCRFLRLTEKLQPVNSSIKAPVLF